MEDNNSGSGGTWIVFIVILVIGYLLLSGWGKYEGRTAEEWFNEYDSSEAKNEELQSKIEEYQTALQEANDNIEDAKRYSGESYDDMESALDNLSAVDSIDEP